MKNQIIHIHALAPEKPALGQPCNGCGICCVLEPCPVSLVLLWPHESSCRALTWDDRNQRYLCGMVMQPTQFLTWLPVSANPFFSTLFKRWIAADQSCDADIELIRTFDNHKSNQ